MTLPKSAAVALFFALLLPLTGWSADRDLPEPDPFPKEGPTLTVLFASVAGVVSVELRNNTKAPLKLFKSANSWGATPWRVLLIRDGKLTSYFLTSRDQAFTRNGPAFNVLGVGDRFRYELDVNTHVWYHHGEGDVSFSPRNGDLLIVSYDIGDTDEAHIYKVWYGVVSTMFHVSDL